jgi:hypothetical protein
MNENEILKLLRMPHEILAREVYALRRYLGECQKHLHESVVLRNKIISDQKEIIVFQHLIIENLEKQLQIKNDREIQAAKNTGRRHTIRFNVRGTGVQTPFPNVWARKNKSSSSTDFRE